MLQSAATAEDDRSIAGEIARSLAAQIVSGTLEPDARLRQDDIAASFKASHVPVREAFRRLEAQGLIVVEPRRGARVASLDKTDIVEVTEMRAALEPIALRYALPFITADDLAQARLEMAACDEIDDIAAWESANRRFHAALYAPSRQKRLLATINDLHQASARHLFATWERLGWQDRSSAEHAEILDAVERGDGEAACAILTTHIREAGLALAATMAE
ncbi:DNA-binding GntR family transcriptional regulator [Sphingopyxis sp. OAS728]|uniref:GntR family transcriptional regulator n=1 Tax=Sphingopyxis sp. OAS728 TaxID=2663823 RepID=UPI001789E2FA|nr:GntR family transcriptional regulator [Sphingopyxis sp. OAS728]MBE1527999.1 DNA-binding GntR family transcriptional regulator [Sphingopyxis sp. OAS728]